MPAEGVFFLVAGPTASGKTTVLRRLLELQPDLMMDVSVTTRSPRPGEVDGRDRRFWDRERFEQEAARGGFLEYAVVHGRDCYGTLKAPVEQRLLQGGDVIKDVDVQGAAQIRSVWAYPRTVLIFVVPPSPRELLARLTGRATETREVVRRRLETASQEVRRVAEYDYLVWNRTVEQAAGDLQAIIRAERLRRARGEDEFWRIWDAARHGPLDPDRL